jgi:hypothetical protein
MRNWCQLNSLSPRRGDWRRQAPSAVIPRLLQRDARTLDLRLDEFNLQTCQSRTSPALASLQTRKRAAIALGVIEDFVSQFRAGHDTARNCALQGPGIIAVFTCLYQSS